jgi:hypothetical protein
MGVYDCCTWIVHAFLECVLLFFVLMTRFSRFVRLLLRRRRPEQIDRDGIRKINIRHLAAILPNGSIHVEDVVFLSRLLLASSAEWVTVYQEHGNLKACKEELEDKLKTFNVDTRRLHLFGFSESEGGLLAAVSSVVAVVSPDKITAAEIRNRLPAQCPDVDLALCFGGPKRNGKVIRLGVLVVLFSEKKKKDFFRGISSSQRLRCANLWNC